MIVSVHQPQYMPWLGYLDKIAQSDIFVVLDCVQYKHREFENRNKIRTKDGWQWLTVPVVTKGKRLQLIKDVRIDNTLAWQRQHWHALQSWYGSCGYFKEYAVFFESFFGKPHDLFCDMAVEVIRHLLALLGITTPIRHESELGTQAQSTARIVEICRSVGADTYLSGEGGKAYLDEEQFRRAGVRLAYQQYVHPRYRQRFSDTPDGFISNLSVLDLLFNEGPASADILLGRSKTS